MDGPHDLGGKSGFGPVILEAHEPVFHNGWEGRVRALQRLVAGLASTATDERRHAIERMDRAHYFASSYYERWLTGTATLAVEHGVISREELERRAGGSFNLSRPAQFSDEFAKRAGGGEQPRFAPGSRVVVLDLATLGHCRCPAYVRGQTGVVTRCDGPYPLPDLVAHRLPVKLDYCDNVEFQASELFEGAEASVKLRIDLFEAYLEAA